MLSVRLNRFEAAALLQAAIIGAERNAFPATSVT